MSAESLARAVREVDERMRAGRADPPTPEQHPMAFVGLGELLDEREHQEQEAGTAA